jgi:cytochrome o ubiquinol oxidase subunit 2
MGWRRNNSAQPAAPRRYSLTALSAVLVGVSGCSGGVLEPRGPIGAANRIILFNALEIMLAIVIPTIIAALVFAWWFRESNARARYQPRFAYSGRIELIVWSIPILVICFLGGVIWIGAHDLDPAKPIASDVKPLRVQVVSLDWKWLFIYPDQQVASVNQLVVPVGMPLHFDLTSASVMNVFFVPQLGSMIYTMNRMVTQLHLQADQIGDYHGISAQFSGDGFPDMQFTVHAVAPNEFTAWITKTRQAGPVLDRTSYAGLLRQEAAQAFTYRQADPSLFRAIVTQQIPPQAGPNTSSGEQRVHPTPEH